MYVEGCAGLTRSDMLPTSLLNGILWSMAALAFCKSTAFQSNPSCSWTMLHSRHCKDWPTLPLHKGSQLEPSPNSGYLSVVHHHSPLTHSRDRSSLTHRTCSATNTGNEYCHSAQQQCNGGGEGQYQHGQFLELTETVSPTSKVRNFFLLYQFFICSEFVQ